jgi:Gram-negative porin
MTQARILAGLAGSALVASLAMLSPAFGASTTSLSAKSPASLGQRDGIGSFTPAATDARLAAALSRSGLSSTGFRFTPASSVRLNRSVTIAVRARTNRPDLAGDQADLVKPATSSIAPIAYNLGAAVGWRKFAVTGDMQKMDLAGLGRRDTLDVGVSYTNKRLTTRVQVAADRASGPAARTVLGGSGVSVDFGSSYSLTRNLDVTAGVRYRADRDRLLPQSDTRRDSQAVYVGTAFRF